MRDYYINRQTSQFEKKIIDVKEITDLPGKINHGKF
jgi:hypothetical protein